MRATQREGLLSPSRCARADRRLRTGWTQVSSTLAQSGPTITATLRDGPLAGRDLEVDVVEGRPPKTINMPIDEANTCRYCLAAWTQSGPSAIYTFLYRV